MLQSVLVWQRLQRVAAGCCGCASSCIRWSRCGVRFWTVFRPGSPWPRGRF